MQYYTSGLFSGNSCTLIEFCMCAEVSRVSLANVLGLSSAFLLFSSYTVTFIIGPLLFVKSEAFLRILHVFFVSISVIFTYYCDRLICIFLLVKLDKSTCIFTIFFQFLLALPTFHSTLWYSDVYFSASGLRCDWYLFQFQCFFFKEGIRSRATQM